MADVRDVRKAKYELERSIAKQVLDFASDYKVTVDGLHFTGHATMQMGGDSWTCDGHVTLEVSL